VATLVLITGTGRSGTSTMSGTLHHLGLSVPGPHLGANESNPKGFFESRWAVRFHKRLAEAAGIDQFDARPQAISYARRAATAELRTQLVERLQRWAGDDQVVVKDPRSVWAQQLWGDAAAQVGREIRYLSMLRHPAESIGSRSTYYVAEGSSEERRRAYEILSTVRWINSQLVSERETRGRVRAFVQYTDLLEDWRAVVTRLRDDLGLTFDTDLTPGEHHPVDDFIEPALRRHGVSWAGLSVPAPLVELAESIWAALAALEQQPDDAAAMAELDRCSARYADLYADATAINQDLVQQGRIAARREGAAEVRAQQSAQQAGQQARGPLVAQVGGRDLLREVGRRAARRLRRSRL